MNDWLRRILFLPEQASTMAFPIDELHYFVIITTMLGATLVTLVGAYYLIRYRRHEPERGQANPHATERPRPILKLMSLIGLAVLFLVFWVLGLGDFVRLRVAPANSMIVYVTAKQWMWKFAYPEGARSIARLYVPAGRPVKLVMTSRDVIHSFFVPAFRVKQDVVPGRYTTLWFEAVAPGKYPVFCTQYCGAAHSMMRAEVVALTPAEFERWLHGEQPPEGGRIAGPVYVEPDLGLTDVSPAEPVSLARQGVSVAANHGCLRCHTLDGTPHLGPTWAGLYGSTVPLDDGTEVVADVAYLTESMMDPNAKLHRGFAPIMPSYLGKLGAGEVAALVELIQSLRDAHPPAAPEPQGGDITHPGQPRGTP